MVIFQSNNPKLRLQWGNIINSKVDLIGDSKDEIDIIVSTGQLIVILMVHSAFSMKKYLIVLLYVPTVVILPQVSLSKSLSTLMQGQSSLTPTCFYFQMTTIIVLIQSSMIILTILVISGKCACGFHMQLHSGKLRIEW